MPKLATTINNLQLKNNLVTGEPSSTWTDEQYPSAKVLYDTSAALKTSINNTETSLKALQDATSNDTLLNLIYPVGSIICNSNPETSGISSGNWLLVDKQFKDTTFIKYPNEDNVEVNPFLNAWTSESVTVNNSTIDVATLGAGNCKIILRGHTIYVKLHFTYNVDSQTLPDAGGRTLGTFDFSSFGLTPNDSKALAVPINFGVATSDFGNCTICYNVAENGTINLEDVLNIEGTDMNSRHNLTKGSTFYIQFSQPVYHSRMDVNYCDKFYWKRIETSVEPTE